MSKKLYRKTTKNNQPKLDELAAFNSDCTFSDSAVLGYDASDASIKPLTSIDNFEVNNLTVHCNTTLEGPITACCCITVPSATITDLSATCGNITNLSTTNITNSCTITTENVDVCNCVNVACDVNIGGNLYVCGTEYITDIEQVKSCCDKILLRDGAVSGLAVGCLSGIEVNKYDGTNNTCVGVDNCGTLRVGDAGTCLEPVLTRDEASNMTDGLPLTWDATNVRAVTSDNAVVKYESSALPNEPVNKLYGITESKTVSNMKLKKFALTYFELSNGTYVPKSNITSTSITIDSNTDLNIVTISSDFTSVNGSITTTKDSLLTGTVNLKKFYIGETANCKYYDVGSGDGSGTIIDINDNSSSSCEFNILQTCEDDLYCSSRLKYIPSTNTLCASNIDGNRLYKCVYLCAGCYDKVGLCISEDYNKFSLNSWIDGYSTGCKKPIGIRTTCTAGNYRQLEVGQWDTGVAGNFGLCHGIAITSNTVDLCSITNTSIRGFGYSTFFGNKIICSNIPSPTYGCCPTVHAITTDCQVCGATVEPGRLMVCCGTDGWKKYLIEGEGASNEIKASYLCDTGTSCICYCSSAKAQDSGVVEMHAYCCEVGSNNPLEGCASLGWDGFHVSCVPFCQSDGSYVDYSCAIIGCGYNIWESQNPSICAPDCVRTFRCGTLGHIIDSVREVAGSCFCCGAWTTLCDIYKYEIVSMDCSDGHECCVQVCVNPYKFSVQAYCGDDCYCTCFCVNQNCIVGSVNASNNGAFRLDGIDGEFQVCGPDTSNCWARVLTECDAGNTCMLKNPSSPSTCLIFEYGNELNTYGTSTLWLNYRGGATTIRIGNGTGADCLGALYSGVLSANNYTVSPVLCTRTICFY